MALFASSLASGSNGNCYYVGNEKEAVLIDAGISCREIEKRMKRKGLQTSILKAIFISHEHSDHIGGVAMFSKKYQLPVYISTSTYSRCRYIEKEAVRHFSSAKSINIGSLTIKPFNKIHDAIDPYSFVISCQGINVGVLTDIGVACQNVKEYFSQCHAVFLESNYDNDMLMKGNYPYHLKRRISGGKGHLSNKEALELFLNHRPPFMSHLFLSHLSKNNNCPQLVQELFNAHCGNTSIILASRNEETDVYHIVKSQLNKMPHPTERPHQLMLDLA
ncbi:MAG TPA: MBL fold metallo-hydrolase [Flavisolibacter sp.]|nr:MBL fold metallo-hydrolase [Flavisolibacter sp.]